jgi:hypothetical protein
MWQPGFAVFAPSVGAKLPELLRQIADGLIILSEPASRYRPKSNLQPISKRPTLAA